MLPGEVDNEVLCHNYNALLVDSTNMDGWADAINRLKNNPSLGMRLSNSAKKDFLDKYTWEKRAQRSIEIGVGRKID